MIIYKITNTINNKVYIGQTIRSLSDRWKQHCRQKNESLICRSIQKYGKENFTIEEIDGANSQSELNYLEEHHIYMNNSMSPIGYNLMTGGNHSTFSEETKSKMSISQTGKKRIFTEEHCKNLSKANKGRKFSDEARNNMSEGQKRLNAKGLNPNLVRNGCKLSQEHKDNISKSNTGRIVSEETRLKISKVKKGDNHSEETKLKISQACIGRKAWNKGKSPSKESIQKGNESRRKTRERKKLNEI